MTGGLFGILLLMTFPSLFVMIGRKKIKLSLYEKNSFETLPNFKYLPELIFAFSFLFFGYNFYLDLDKFLKSF